MKQGWHQGWMSQLAFKSVVFSLFFVFHASAEAKVTITETANATHYDFVVEDLEIKEIQSQGESWIKPRLKGVEGYEGVLYQVGMPEIPVVRFYVEGNGKVEVEALSQTMSYATTPKGQKVIPVQAPVAKIEGAMNTWSLNQSVYQKNEEYPKSLYQVEDAGKRNGVLTRMVTLFPMSYNPATGDYRLQAQFTVRVAKEDVSAAGPIFKRKPLFAFIVGSQFKDSPSLKEYKKAKKRAGFKVIEVIVGEELFTPEEIRAWIQEVYSTQTRKLEHVLIVGDSEDVPGYDSDVIIGTTDHYYRAIDTDDYVSDVNGPDVGVGRFPASSELELEAMISKSIRYDRGKFQDWAWLEQASFLATNDRWQVAEETHNSVINDYTVGMGYHGVFPESPLPGGDKLYAITHRVTGSKTVETIAQGRSIIQYSGHGAKTYWDAPRVSQDDVRSLSHEDAMPFVISNACITGDFRIPESFAETWVRHPQGAIAFWGSMDNTYWDEDDVLERRQYKGMFEEGARVFRDITDYSLSQFWLHYGGKGKSQYYWETYTFFGDPSLTFRDSKSRD